MTNWNAARALLVALVLGASGCGGAGDEQPPSLVKDVRAAIARQDFAAGDRLVEASRASAGDSPEVLEAISWLGRGALAAGRLDAAEAYAQRAYDGATAALRGRALDAEPRLPIALGAAIEVLGQSSARRGTRSEAVAFLQDEVRRYAGTSIEKRLRKNLLLLSLEGTQAPPLDLSEQVAGHPPAPSTLTGNVTVLFFWAHWCVDCKAQEPALARVMQKYAAQGLRVIAPTQRFGYVAGGREAGADEEAAYIATVSDTSYRSLAQSPMPLAEANHRAYGVSTTPTIVLVDREGLVRLYHPGGMTEADLDAALRPLLGGS